MNPFQETTTARKIMYGSMILFGISFAFLGIVMAIGTEQKADKRDYETIDRMQSLWQRAEDDQVEYTKQVDSACSSLVERYHMRI